MINYNVETVYIPICCLGIDQELEHTIHSAINNADDPSRLYFGIAMVGNLDFFEYISERLAKYSKNIKIKYFNIVDNFGVGKGRILANSFYNDQDYVLQIDAHTRLAPGWDTNMINSFKDALKFTNNNKTILTGLPGPYSYINNNDNAAYPINVTNYLGYPIWQQDQYIIEKYNIIPKWEKVAFQDTSSKIINLFEKNGFVPVPKISAAFIFSNSEFIKNQGISEDFLFWEEEILQSIELINSGFTLLYTPNIQCIYHLYSKNISTKGHRDSFQFLFDQNIITKSYFIETIKNNFFRYLNNPDNASRIKRFEEYAKINLLSGPEDDPFPDTYINLI
jgi:hypothetical protein